MIYSNRFIDVAFGDHDFEKLLDSIENGNTVSSTALLAALAEESEEVLQEAFDHLELMNITLDIADLPKAAGTGEAALRLRQEEAMAKSGNLLGSLEDTDPLRLYLEELAGIPVCGDLRLMAAELAKANLDEREAPELWQKILNLSLSRVVSLACEHTGYGVLLSDLIQEGSMGLWQGLIWYTDGDFEAFCDRCIRQAMAKIITHQAFYNGIGQKMRQALEDFRMVDERLLTELGRNPTLEEIALELHMTVEEAAAVEETLEAARMMSRAKASAEETQTEEEEQAVEDTAYFQMRQRIQELLSTLSKDDAKLLTLRFGLEGGLPLSPVDAGKQLGLTPEEVVAREAAVLAQLRGN